MARRTFERLAGGILRHFGEDAVLRLDESCRVSVQHGVEVEDGDRLVRASVATLDRTLAAKRGDSLRFISGEAYVIDSPPLEDDGYLASHMLRRVAT